MRSRHDQDPYNAKKHMEIISCLTPKNLQLYPPRGWTPL